MKYTLKLLRDPVFDQIVEDQKHFCCVDFYIYSLAEYEHGVSGDLLHKTASVNAMRCFSGQTMYRYTNHYFHEDPYVEGPIKSGKFDEITKEEFLGSYPQWISTSDSTKFLECDCEKFLYAYFNPPHPPDREKAQKNYDRLVEYLFQNFEDELVFYKGPIDWSWYFDAGQEWWGSFHWQVWNKTKNWLIVIMASTTD